MSGQQVDGDAVKVWGCLLCRRWNREVTWEAGGCYWRCVDVGSCNHARYRRNSVSAVHGERKPQ